MRSRQIVAAADRDLRCILDIMAETASRKEALVDLQARVQLNEHVVRLSSHDGVYVQADLHRT